MPNQTKPATMELEYETVSFKTESEIKGIFADADKFSLEKNNFRVIIVIKHSPAWGFFKRVFTITDEDNFILITREKAFSSEHDEQAVPLRELTKKMRAYIHEKSLVPVRT